MIRLLFKALLSLFLSSCFGQFESDSSATGDLPISPIVITEDNFYPSRRTHAILIKNQNIYVTHEKGLSISKDKGFNWKNIRIGCQDAVSSCVSMTGALGVTIDDNNVIYVSTKYGLYFSSDEGSTWTLATSRAYYPANEVQLHSSNTTILSQVYNGLTGYGFAYTENQGATWNRVSVPDSNGNDFVNDIEISAGKIYLLAAATDGVCLRRSANMGQSWTNITPSDLQSLNECPVSLLLANSRIYLTGSNGGVYVSSDDGATWSKKTTADGLPNISSRYLAFDGTRVWAERLLAQDLGFSTDDGLSWTSIPLGQPTFNLQGIKAELNLIVGGSVGQGLIISDDGGTTFRLVGYVD